MLRLRDYINKYVILIDTKGIVHKGLVGLYESKYDNDSDEDSIGILTNEKAGLGFEFYESDIKSIVIDEEREKNR